jgi:hypothetical protein
MDNDFRSQFNQIKPKIRRQWLKIIVAFVCAIPYVEIVSRLVDPKYVRFFVFAYGLFYLYPVLKLLDFRCPNCSKSLYVTKYFGNKPFLVQTWVNASCQHCGVRLK